MKSISCKEAVHFILKKEERKLSVWDRLRLGHHLMICSVCRIFLVQNKLINKIIRQRKRQDSLSEAEKEIIVRNVLEK